MFRAFSGPLLVKVPYASLFPHNRVLHAVFTAPPGRVALTVEAAGRPKADFTYGRLQREVVRVADRLVARRAAVAASRGDPPERWQQTPRPAAYRGPFAPAPFPPPSSGAGPPDTGHYTAALLTRPSYAGVVALLAGWAVNQLMTPLPAGLPTRELTDALVHSGARTLLGEAALLRERLPPLDAPRGSRGVGRVDTLLAMEPLLEEGDGGRTMPAPEVLAPVSETRATMWTAEDVVNRLERERAAAREAERSRLEELLREQHQERNAVPDEADEGDPLCFDSETLEELNPVFLRWYTDPASRPTRHDDCLMLYTSGTTARPKGVVHTHASVSNMVRTLQEAWEWRCEDSILNVLPLSHIHGLVNILLCALASGARCVLTKFDNPARIAHRLEQGDITLFMAVPAIYTRMIAAIQESFSPIEKTGFRKACSQSVRLMVSGSSALPAATLQRFRELSGHTLLERYGMTEIGMALGQPLRPLSERIPSTVGFPLATVQTCLLDPESSDDPTEVGHPETAPAEVVRRHHTKVGVLGVASESVFDRYWNNPEATMKELHIDADGQRFFITGDTVRVRYPLAGVKTPPLFTIMGRTSVDIIKSNGYKLSALEIEAAMLLHSDVFYEVAVVGVKHEVKGEEVVAVVALQPEAAQTYGIEYDTKTNAYESDGINTELRRTISDVLAPYKHPRRYICVPKIPRNENGKVNKKELKKALKLQ